MPTGTPHTLQRGHSTMPRHLFFNFALGVCRCQIDECRSLFAKPAVVGFARRDSHVQVFEKYWMSLTGLREAAEAIGERPRYDRD